MQQNDEKPWRWLSILLSVLLLGMVALVFFNVVARHFFNLVWIPLQELAVYLHAVVFMLGIVLAWQADRHVRVDVFFQRFPAPVRQRVNRWGIVLLLLPFLFFMLQVSWPYVHASWQRLEGSAETGGLPGVFVLKTLLLVMPAMLLALVLYKGHHFLPCRRNKENG